MKEADKNRAHAIGLYVYAVLKKCKPVYSEEKPDHGLPGTVDGSGEHRRGGRGGLYRGTMRLLGVMVKIFIFIVVLLPQVYTFVKTLTNR